MLKPHDYRYRYTFNMTTVEGNTNIFHQFLEASKFAYAARSYFGDMDFIANASAIAKTITSEEWAKQIRWECFQCTQRGSKRYVGRK